MCPYALLHAGLIGPVVNTYVFFVRKGNNVPECTAHGGAHQW